MALEIILASFITGVIVKLTDQIADRPIKKIKNLEIFLGLVYGFLIAFVVLQSPIVSNLWIAAVLGNILAGKIDSMGHKMALFSIILTLSIAGFPKLDTLLLFVFLAASYADEFFKDISTNKKIKNKTFSKVASYRLLLEITALVVSVYTYQWILFAAIFSFDFGYIISNRLINKNIK